jgi:hypothetical protein
MNASRQNTTSDTSRTKTLSCERKFIMQQLGHEGVLTEGKSGYKSHKQKHDFIS